ncbi:MAG: type 2 isopentenyl-diphosphate Delta-isomerase [Thermomicrobiales bacterium]
MSYIKRFPASQREVQPPRITKANITQGKDSNTIEQRKSDHLAINIERDVRAKNITSGFERYTFVHEALPELDLDAIDVRTSFLGHHLEAPLLISSMTGGVERGWEINRRLAHVAQALGCAIGVGSQRAGLEDGSRARYFSVRDVAPDVLLFANLGAVQLNYGYGPDECQRAIEMIDADALILHLNPLQEAIQSDGNRDFSGLLSKISRLCRSLEKPVVVKEIGGGISASVAKDLVEAGVAAIDVAGAGGTSWSKVEGLRATTALGQRLGETFSDWGIPTATSVRMARAGAPLLPLIASGGLLTGVDAAKAVALGASLAGFAGPLLRAAAVSEQEAFDLMSALIEELRLAMFCTSSATLSDLRTAKMMQRTEDTEYHQNFLMQTPAPKAIANVEEPLIAVDRLAD